MRSLRLGVRGMDGFMRHSFKVMHNGLYSVNDPQVNRMKAVSLGDGKDQGHQHNEGREHSQ